MQFALCWVNAKQRGAAQMFAASERSERWRALLSSAGQAWPPLAVPWGLQEAHVGCAGPREEPATVGLLI